MTTEQAVLKGDEIVAGYIPEVNILNGCNLVVGAGEFVGIIGPNGAGKSTFLKAVLGQCSVRSGTVTFKGEDITGLKAHQLVSKGVGYVPQTRNVFPSLTVTENLEMGCFLRPKVFKERFEYVVELFPRLHQRKDSKAGSLSGGERQMVAMSRALMLEPALLLLDEPSAGLSPVLQDEVFLQCKAINRTGVAILMVEQKFEIALANSDRCLVIDHGELVHACESSALLADPAQLDRLVGVGH